MDIQLILGPNNSGKSLYAEKMVAETKNIQRIYLATMIPQTEDNKQRIKKHIDQRAGKSFHTIEEPWKIHTLDIPKNSVVLLEDASNLLANGIFIHHSNYQECFERILTLAEACKKLIVVSINGLFPSDTYDTETNDYIRQLHLLNELLENVSSSVKNFS